MFRVVETIEGSTSVYASSTGSLVMVIANANKENHHSKCSDLSKANRKMVPLPSLNSGAMEYCKTGLFPMISLEDINVSRNIPEAKPLVKKDKPVEMVTRVNSTESIGIASGDDEYDCIDQESFMGFFGLSSTRKGIESVKNLERFRQKRTVNLVSYVRNDICDVDLTSNLGTFMRDNSLNMCTPSEASNSLIAKYDAYCQATTRRLGNWDALRKVKSNYAITYPVSKRQSGTHIYVFSRRQRLQQFRRLQTGLTRRSRRLVKLCTDCSVKVTRLTERQIRNCSENVNLEPTLHSRPDTAEVTIENVVTVESGDSGLCIDGTVVIEIDEFGSETVRVSQKPSKQIDPQSGNLWLSPRKVSILRPLLQCRNHCPATAASAKSRLRADTFEGVLPDVTILPVTSMKPEGRSERLRRRPPVEVIPIRSHAVSASAHGDCSDPDIQFLGSFMGRETTTTPLTRRSSGSPFNRQHLNTGSNAPVDPQNFVQTSYNADASSARSPGTRPSFIDRVNILRKLPGRSCSKLEQREDVSVEAILQRKSQFSICPHPKTSDVTRSSPRLPACAPATFRVQCLAEGDGCRMVCRHEAEQNLISGFIGLDEQPQWVPLTPSSSGVGCQSNCVFRCHICGGFEQEFDANAIDGVYDHISVHGDLSLASLVSHQERRQGTDVIVLQAFPLSAA